MNANKRIEEFIMKLIIRQNDPGLFSVIDELTLISHFNTSTMSAKKSYHKYVNKLFCDINIK